MTSVSDPHQICVPYKGRVTVTSENIDTLFICPVFVWVNELPVFVQDQTQFGEEMCGRLVEEGEDVRLCGMG